MNLRSFLAISLALSIMAFAFSLPRSVFAQYQFTYSETGSTCGLDTSGTETAPSLSACQQEQQSQQQQLQLNVSFCGGTYTCSACSGSGGSSSNSGNSSSKASAASGGLITPTGPSFGVPYFSAYPAEQNADLMNQSSDSFAAYLQHNSALQTYFNSDGFKGSGWMPPDLLLQSFDPATDEVYANLVAANYGGWISAPTPGDDNSSNGSQNSSNNNNPAPSNGQNPPPNDQNPSSDDLGPSDFFFDLQAGQASADNMFTSDLSQLTKDNSTSSQLSQQAGQTSNSSSAGDLNNLIITLMKPGQGYLVNAAVTTVFNGAVSALGYNPDGVTDQAFLIAKVIKNGSDLSAQAATGLKELVGLIPLPGISTAQAGGSLYSGLVGWTFNAFVESANNTVAQLSPYANSGSVPTGQQIYNQVYQEETSGQQIITKFLGIN